MPVLVALKLPRKLSWKDERDVPYDTNSFLIEALGGDSRLMEEA